MSTALPLIAVVDTAALFSHRYCNKATDLPEVTIRPGMTAPAYNPSALGDWGRKITSLTKRGQITLQSFSLQATTNMP